MTPVKSLTFALALALIIAPPGRADEEAITPVSPNLYLTYDCDTLSVFEKALRNEVATVRREERLAAYAEFVVARSYSTTTPEEAAARIAWLRGHHAAVDAEFRARRCEGNLSGGVGSGAVWSMSPGKIVAFRRAVANAPFQAPPPRAGGGRVMSDGQVRPLPTGPNVARPVDYSASEIARYCDEGWDHRRLSNGKIEYNPCFYK